MQRGVDVCADMDPGADLTEITGARPVEIAIAVPMKGRIAGPMDHAVGQGSRDVDPFFHVAPCPSHATGQNLFTTLVDQLLHVRGATLFFKNFHRMLIFFGVDFTLNVRLIVADDV